MRCDSEVAIGPLFPVRQGSISIGSPKRGSSSASRKAVISAIRSPSSAITVMLCAVKVSRSSSQT
jgi:hypothetical protein